MATIASPRLTHHDIAQPIGAIPIAIDKLLGTEVSS